MDFPARLAENDHNVSFPAIGNRSLRLVFETATAAAAVASTSTSQDTDTKPSDNSDNNPVKNENAQQELLQEDQVHYEGEYDVPDVDSPLHVYGDESDDESGEVVHPANCCVICLIRIINVKLLPCCHRRFCFKCIQRLLDSVRQTPGNHFMCPICRQSVEFVKLYMPDSTQMTYDVNGGGI